MSTITSSKDSKHNKRDNEREIKMNYCDTSKCNYQNNGEMMKGTNHKKMVKAKWGDDDR